MKGFKFIFYILIFGLISACQSTSKSPLEELASNDIVVGTASGAAIGALIGGLIDGKNGAQKGALIGAGVGFVAGNVAKKRRQNFASDAEFLDAEIASANDAISTKEQQLSSIEMDIKKSDLSILALKQQLNQNKNISEDLRSLHIQLKEKLEQNQTTQRKFQQSLEYLDSVMSNTKIESAETANEKIELETKVASLSNKREKLTTQLARLNGINEEISRQQDSLIALSKRTGTPLPRG